MRRSNGTYDNAEFARRVRDQFADIHAKAAAPRDFAPMGGGSYGTRAGGFENTNDNEFWAQLDASPEAYDLTTDLLGEWQVKVGPQYTWYNDCRPDKHGYARHISQAVEPIRPGAPISVIREALFNKIDAVAILAD